jgi:predicted RND superfamily exporter protein
VSGILFIGFLALTWSAIFIQKDMSLIARILIPSLAFFASYITNPFNGALKYLRLLIERIEDFNRGFAR